MLPYSFPTTVVLIDDDQSFLQSFEDRLGSDFVVRRFDNPLHGLNHLIGGDAEHASGLARLSARTQHGGWVDDETARQQALLSSLVGQVRSNPQRFDTVSVAVVDVNMPDVDGLMICRALRRRPVRTVLLTGSASEGLALSAFNDGMIDRFLSKHDPEFTTLIAQHVRDMQNAYFRRVSVTVRQAMEVEPLNFSRDSAFLRHFDDMVARQSSVEHYVRLDPPGVDLIRSDGQAIQYLVLDHRAAAERAASARAAGADPEMVAALEARTMLAQFPNDSGHYDPRYRDTWQLYASPAQSVGTKWLVATMASHDGSQESRCSFASFDAFLQARVG